MNYTGYDIEPKSYSEMEREAEEKWNAEVDKEEAIRQDERAIENSVQCKHPYCCQSPKCNCL